MFYSLFDIYKGIINDKIFFEQINVLAQFGDFIGGTLNPIFSFFTIIILLFTIYIQTKELEVTRRELKESRIAQQEQSESLKLQNEATKLQIFENTFFKLLDLIIVNKNNISTKTFSEDLYSSKAIKLLLSWCKTSTNYDKFNNSYEKDTGVYFGQIYQILKFINDSNIESKQRYINIFRAQFTKDELEFLFYHCLGTIGKRKFKKLVEDYEFFEHIILNNNIEKQLLEYDIKAFGKNEKILEKYNELKNKILNQTLK
jgi:hypothetical protein